MKPKSILIFILLTLLLLQTTQNSTLETINLKQKIIKKFNKNQSKLFNIPPLEQSKLNSTLFLRAKLARQYYHLFLQPQISLQSGSDTSKTLLICNQVGNKFYQICSLAINQLLTLDSLRINILSLVDAQIEIEVYVGNEYKIQLGEEILIHRKDQQYNDNEEKQLDYNERKTILLMEIPVDIKEFESIQFSLIEMRQQVSLINRQMVQQGDGIGQQNKKVVIQYPRMIISHSQQIQGLQRGLDEQIVNSNKLRKGIIYKIKGDKVKHGDYIKITILSTSQVRFHSIYTIKDKLTNTIINNAQLNCYYNFNMISYDYLILKYNNLLSSINSSNQLEITIYHSYGSLSKIDVSINPNQNYQSNHQIQFYIYKQYSLNNKFNTQSFSSFILTYDNIRNILSNSINPTSTNQDIYLKLSTFNNPTTFYISLRVYQKDQTIQQQWPQVVQFSSISNNNTLKSDAKLTLTGTNFLFEDTLIINSTSANIFTKQKYTVQINNQLNFLLTDNNQRQRQINIFIDRCQSMQKQGNIDCFQLSKQALINSTITQTQIVPKIQRPQNLKFKTFLTFQYQLSKCPILTYSKNYAIHKCYFNFFFYSLTQQIQTFKPFEFILHKQQQLFPLIYLRINMHSTFLILILPAQLNSVAQTAIYLTTYFGDCILFGSRYQKNPQYQFIQTKKYDVGLGGFLQINRITEIEGKYNYFISVYCYEQSEFHLQVVTKYTNKQSIYSNNVTLVQGYPTQWNLKPNNKIRFAVENSYQIAKLFVIEIDELQGHINYQIQIQKYNESSQQKIECPQQFNNEKNCKIYLQPESKAYIIVSPKKNFNSEQQTKFIILTQSQFKCLHYPSNQPQLIDLEPGQTVCTKFKISKYDDLQFTLSMTDLQFLSSNLDIYATFNGNPNKILVENMMAFWNQKQLKQYCQNPSFSNQPFNFFIDCELELTIHLQSSNTVTLTQIIQFTNSQSMLLNGLQRLSNINSLSRYNFKKYFYNIEDITSISNDIKISFNLQSNKDLILVARIQNEELFETQPNDFYPGFPLIEDKRQFVIRLTNGQKYGHLYIPSNKITCENIKSVNPQKSVTNKISQCVLLISIFGSQQIQDEQQHFIYTLQVNQGYTVLQVGQSVEQVIAKNNRQQFQVLSIPNVNTLIHIFSIDQTANGEICFQAQIYPLNIGSNNSLTTISQNGKYILSSTQQQIMIVEISTKDNLTGFYCTYTIAYTIAESPIYEIQQTSLIHLSYSYSESILNSRYSFLIWKYLVKIEQKVQSQISVTQNSDKIQRIVGIYNGLVSSSNINFYATQFSFNNQECNISKLIVSFFSQSNNLVNSNNFEDILKQFEYSQNQLSQNYLKDDNQFGLTFRTKLTQNSQTEETNQFIYFLIVVQNTKIKSSQVKQQINYNKKLKNTRIQTVSIQIYQPEQQELIIQSDTTIVDKIIQKNNINNANTDQFMKIYKCVINLKNPQILISPVIYLNFNLIYGQVKILLYDPINRIIYQKIISQPSTLKQQINISHIVNQYNPSIIRIPSFQSKFSLNVIGMSSQVLYSLSLLSPNPSGGINLMEKIPYMVEINYKNDSNEFVYESNQKYFIIDGKHIDEQNKIDETINIVIGLFELDKDKQIGDILVDLMINSTQWNKDQQEEEQKRYNMNNLVMDKHRQFYSIKLATLKNGKYQISFSKLQNIYGITKLSIVFYHTQNNKLKLLTNSTINSQNSSQNSSQNNSQNNFLNNLNKQTNSSNKQTNSHTLIPISYKQKYSHILPFNTILQIPIPSSTINILISIISCSLIQPKISIGQGSKASLNQLSQLHQQNNNGSVNIIQNQNNPLNPFIYLKSIQQTKIYLKIQPHTNNSQSINSQFDQYILKIIQNPRPFMGWYFTTQQNLTRSIKSVIQNNELQITYSKLQPHINNLKSQFGSFQQSLGTKKIIYKLYLSQNQQSLIKRSQCQIHSLIDGKQNKGYVYQKIIHSQSIKQILQTAINNTNKDKTQDFSYINININQLSQKSLKGKIYIRIKAYIVSQLNQSIYMQQNKDTQNLQAQQIKYVPYGYQSYLYELGQININYNSSLFSASDIGFSKIMWIAIISVICGILIIFLLWKGLKILISRMSRSKQESLHQQDKGPQIKISTVDKLSTNNNSDFNRLSADSISVISHSIQIQFISINF